MKHTKRILSLLLAVAMMVGMLPLSAFRVSAASGSIWVGGVEMASGDYLAVGAAATQETQPSDGYAHFENGVLTLHNYEYEGTGYKYSTSSNYRAGIYAEAGLRIVLEGENTLTQTENNSDCVYVSGAGLILEESGDGHLNLTASRSGVYANGGDVIINSGTVNAAGIVTSWGNVTINGGTVTLDADSYGICALNDGDVTVNGGTVTIGAACAFGISAYNGSVTINDGTVTIDANWYGIYAPNGDVTIESGNITVRARYTKTGTSYQAIHCEGNFTVDEGLPINASANPFGALSEYVAEDHDTYGLIAIGDNAPVLSYPYTVWVGGVEMASGDYLAVGASATQKTQPSGGYAYFENGVLTLRNYKYEGAGYKYSTYYDDYAVIYSAEDLKIVLEGKNILTQTADNSDCIYAEFGLTLGENGTGSLILTASSYDGRGINASNAVTIKGGTVTIDADYEGIHVRAVTIDGGTVTIDAGKYGIYVSNAVTINGGTVTIDAYEDGVFTYNGDVTINGGNVMVKSWKTGEDASYQAIDCSGSFTIADGLTVKASISPFGPLGEYAAENHDTYDLIMIGEIEPDLFYSHTVWVGGVEMTSGDYLAVGTSATQETQPSEGYAYFENGVLTLHNYQYEGAGYEYDTEYDNYAVIYAETYLKIVLEGENILTQTAGSSDCIGVSRAGLILEENGDSSLNLTTVDTGISASEVTINGGTVAIEATCYRGIIASDVTINDGTVTIDGFHGIISSNATINGGTVTIDAGGSGVYADNVTINDGTVTIDADQTGISGYYGVAINGGTVTIDAYQEGIYTYHDVTINGGTVTIDVGYYGIRARNGDVTIKGGNVAVKSRNTSDDNSYQAIYCDNFTVADGLTIKASTEPDGTPGEYVAENHHTYDLIVIGEEPETPYPYPVWVGGVGMDDGDYLAVGASATQKAKPSDEYAHFENGVLTLHNYQYEGTGYKYSYNSYAVIYAERELKIVLEGENTLTQTADFSAGIYIGEGNLTLEEIGNGSLNLIAGYGVHANDGNVTINGATVTIDAGRGIDAYGAVAINDGTATIDTHYDGISASQGVTINGGTVTIDAGYRGIHATDGDVAINGNTITIDAGWDGIIAYNGNVTIDDGTVTIDTDGAGIYAYTGVTINGGTVTVDADEYGIVAATPNGDVAIYGGNVAVRSMVSYYQAIQGYHFIVANGLTVKASTSPFGPLDEYAAADHDTYHLITIGDNAPELPYPYTVWVGGVGMADGDYLAVGVTATQETQPSGGYAYFENGVLTLHDYEYEGAGYEYHTEYDFYALIYAETDLKIILEGENTLIQTADYSECIYVEKADLTLAENGNGSIHMTAPRMGIEAYDGSVSIEDGTVTIDADGRGIIASNVTVKGGTVTIDAEFYGIYVHIGDVTINDGTVTIDTDGNGISASNVTINDGTVTIDADQLGISAVVNADQLGISSSNVTINGGTVTIDAGEYGIDAWIGNVAINGGTVVVGAGEYGIDAWYGDVAINGGTVAIDADSYGIYAYDGTVTIEGGNGTVRSWKTENDNSYQAIKYDEGDFMIADGLTIKASTEPDGTPGEYVAANHDSYDLIVIGDGSSITVTDIGDVNYTVSGNIVTVAQEAVGKVGYWDGSKYIAITATAKGDGTYFFTAPAGVTQVLLAVKGDANGDGNISLADSTKAKAAYNKKTTLTAEALFALDTNGDGAITLADSTKIKAMYNKKTTLSW